MDPKRKAKRRQSKKGKSPAIYVSVRTLADRYSVKPSTIWRWTKAGTFPAPIVLSRKCTRWRVDEIEAHEEKLEADSRA